MLFNKRLFSKASFVVILILIPAFVFGMSAVSANGGTVLSVALSAETESALTSEIFDELLDNEHIIDFSVLSREDALASLSSGDIDAVWHFPEDLAERIVKFADEPTARNYIVDVYQREETVLHKVSRERLNAAIFPNITFALMEIYSGVDGVDLELSKNELEQFYNNASAVGENLFNISYFYGGDAKPSGNILFAPLRGIVSVLAVIGGIAVCLFYLQDERAQRLMFVPAKKRFVFSVIYTLTAVFDIAIVTLLSFSLSGNSKGFLSELLLSLFLMLSITVFSVFIRSIFSRVSALGIVIPLLSLVLILLSPIFFTVNMPIWIEAFIPTASYLKLQLSRQILPYTAVANALMLLISFVIFKIRNKIKY